MKTSETAITKIKEFEGLKLRSYYDSAGVMTIGYGHTKNVHNHMTITPALATQFLLQDLRACENNIIVLGLTHLKQGQFDALVSFVFNLGIGTFRRSTLLTKIKTHAPDEEIQAEFRKWCYAGGRKLQGLVKRREWEAQRWVE